LHYTVAAVIGNKEGVKSNTINYKLQGVECFIRSFYAILISDKAELTLSLGTLFNINTIVLEKFNGTGFQAIQQLTNITNLMLTFTDINLTRGLNIYRIKLELTTGGVVYTLPESVFYFKDKNFIIYPNPAAQNTEVNIEVKDVDTAIMEVYSAMGIKVFEKQLNDGINKIPAGKLSKGVYFISITNNDVLEDLLKLVVY
jgi:hypothetical protein